MNLVPPRVSRGVDTARFVARTYRTLHALKHGRLTPRDAGRVLADDVTAMGPLYVKMAQFVSSRRDAVDPDLADALAVVQDDVPASEFPTAMPGYVFCQEPVGSASIAVVFRGKRLRDGKAVALKQRHAGADVRIREDLPLLAAVMSVASAVGLPGARNMTELLRETTPTILGELDFRQEARSQTSFRALVKDVGWLRVPRVYEAREDAMVSEFVAAHKVSRVKAPNPALATRLMDMYMLMIDRGLVHADPHPGNLGVLPDGSVVLYDFGAVLPVPPRTRQDVTALLQAATVRDAEGTTRALERLGVLHVRDDQRLAVRRTMRRALSGDDDVHVELQNSPGFASGNSSERVVAFSREFVYLVRTFALVDGACRALDPEFSYDFSSRIDASPLEVVSAFARQAASMPSTMQTMQLDMEEFQMRIVKEIEDARRAVVVVLMAAAAAWWLI